MLTSKDADGTLNLIFGESVQSTSIDNASAVEPPVTADKTSNIPYLLTSDLTPTPEPTEAIEYTAERASR
jgi:hypothetical protein